jgi:hypothetical protein
MARPRSGLAFVLLLSPFFPFVVPVHVGGVGAFQSLVEILDLKAKPGYHGGPPGGKGLNAARSGQLFQELGEAVDDGSDFAAQGWRGPSANREAWHGVLFVLDSNQDLSPSSQGLLEF